MSTSSRHRSPGRSRGAGRATNPSSKKWRTRVLGLGAVVALGAGIVVGPSASAQASLGSDFSMDEFSDLLNNEMILDYLEVCQNGAAAGEGANVAEAADTDVQPVAVADCSQATGDGLAIVIPEKIELGNAAENVTIDLGDDVNIPIYGKFELGERNLFEILSAAALGSNTIKSIVGALGLPKIDPTQLGKYSSYEQVQADAALPVDMIEERTCSGVQIGSSCFGSWKTRTYDKNEEKRENAMKIAEYLTGEKYDYAKPVELPDLNDSSPRGTATTVGDGITVAAAMRDGNALAEAKKLFGLPSAAISGADGGRASISHSTLGLSTALNMDTNEIGLTWFGQALDLTKLKELGIDEYAGDEAMGMLDTAENLEIPALKEVSCFGVYTTATAEGLGSCTNILGTFDRYEDLRDPVVGESRQKQWGLTDLSSLVLGNDALVKQLTGDTEETPFLDDLMDNITSEDDRLKFAKDFVRFTQNVTTEEVEVPKLDEEGNPVLDDDGNPVMETTTRETTAAWLTSDYGLRDPVTVEWLGHRVVFFPAVDVNGTSRPNLLSLPQIEKITDDADTGLLPKVSLVTWDNAFGLGTVTLDDLTRPDRIFTNWAESVTLPDDLKYVGDLLGLSGSENAEESEAAEDEKEAEGTDSTEIASPASASSTPSSPARISTQELTEEPAPSSSAPEPPAEDPTTPSAAEGTPTPSDAPTEASDDSDDTDAGRIEDTDEDPSDEAEDTTTD
ncbi:MAG TPA: hypothetical protein H9751_01565 [Candidatus Corynebacterium faecigallinarum]|uniref:Uncharacterized protein n=1 Tax=Candidatus Corynebacterium faecigallinarum TaxID=2838528 RepID=A0A9D2QB32_9CORY|nr:hypothetical protein [Candidatus Corynebacterium faecigallinarum]